jgi:tetratricopeptide (TPR) repeat protein
MNRYEESLASLAASHRLAGNDSSLLAQVEIVRASVLGRYSLGSREETEAAQAALRHARAAQDTFHEASALGNLGFLLLLKGRYEEAIYWFSQVIPLARQHDSRSLLALTLDNLGWSWFRLGEVDRAQSYFNESNALFARMGKKQNLHVNYGNQGSAWLMRGEYRKAIGLFEQAQRIAHELGDQPAEADWLTNLAAAHLELGDLRQAGEHLDRAQQLKFENSERQTPAWLALYRGRLAEKRGDEGRARAEYEQVIRLVSGEPTVLFEARSRLAKLAAATGDLPGAERQYRALVEDVERRRAVLSTTEARISWLSSLIRFYKDYVQFLWAQGRPAEALAVAESSRARVLAERTGGSARSRHLPVEQLPEHSRRLGCTLAAYWLGDRESYLWVYPPSGQPAYHRLPARQALAADVAAVRRQIETLRDPTLYPALSRISQSLLPAGTVPAEGCLLVAPDEELYGLNFETLIDGQRFLVEKAEVRVTPALTLVDGAAQGGKGLLLFGDPVTPPQSHLPALRQAGAELQSIARLFPGSTLISGPQATPEAFLQAPLRDFDLIHISAHATANRQSPLDSAVVLTQVEGRYQLTAREVANLDLRARLVSLSACHSAGIRSYSGEGTVGLAWGFLHAGARNVIAGLWAIDDQSSSRLLQQTYAGLRAGMPPANALRAAKLSFLAEEGPLRKPFYWAPFQLYSLN